MAFVPTVSTVLPTVPNSKQRRVSRKMSLIRRSGLFGADTKGARISRAATLEDLRDAYKLVHKVYLGTGFISEEQAEMRLRIFETSPDTATFVAKKDGRVVGVLSIVHDSAAFGLPSDEAFADELRDLRATGLKLGEVTNQAVDEEFRSTAVPTELMRCALAHGIEAGFDLGIAAVSPSHNAFYELLGFRQIGGSRSYSGKIHDPVVPLQIDLAEHRNPQRQFDEVEAFMHSFLTAENPYFLYVNAWEKVARDRFSDPDLLRGLFVEERDFLGECSEHERLALHEHWGHEIFHRVTGPLFVRSLPPLVPDLNELEAPQPDRFSLPRITPETPLARDVAAAVMPGLAAGRPQSWERDVQTSEAREHRVNDESAPVSESRSWWGGRQQARKPGRRITAFRDMLSSVWRNAGLRTPREAN